MTTAAAGFEIPGATAVGYAAMARLMPSDEQAKQAAAEGSFVETGCIVTAGSGYNVNISAGTIIVAGVAIAISARTNLSIGAAADGTNPKWVIVEASSSDTITFTHGTAASSPLTPDTTSGRVMLAAILVPASATLMEAWQGTADGKGQIISKRMLRAAGTVDIQTYTTAGSYTWTKPAGAREVEVICVGAGGGGGSGRTDAAGTLRGGGSGGQSGCRSRVVLPASELGSTETVTVGLGGTGGPQSGTALADGQVGVAGTASSFGSHVKAGGGTNGLGGTSAAGGANGFLNPNGPWTAGGGPGLLGGGGGNGTTAATAAGSPGINSGSNGSPFYASNADAAGGGGGGGGIPTGNGEQVGAVGGNGAYVYDPTQTQHGAAGAVHAAGGNATQGTTTRPGGGGGGGGSSATNTVDGGKGGNGIGGGGGGGGGASTTGSTAKSGAGGVGGDGFVVIISRA